MYTPEGTRQVRPYFPCATKPLPFILMERIQGKPPKMGHHFRTPIRPTCSRRHYSPCRSNLVRSSTRAVRLALCRHRRRNCTLCSVCVCFKCYTTVLMFLLPQGPPSYDTVAAKCSDRGQHAASSKPMSAAAVMAHALQRSAISP